MPEIAPLLSDQPLDVRFKLLKKFLLEALRYSVTSAIPKQKDMYEAAAACIGLEPWQGGLLGLRLPNAEIILGKPVDTIRRPDWRQKFINTLVCMVSDFLDDQDAVAAFIKENRLTKQVTDDPTLASPTLAAADHPRPTLQPTYVHRPGLEAQFRSLVTTGAKIIVLVGQPGMGKTWLAEELTRDPRTGAPAPFLDVSKQEHFARDIMAAFSTSNARPPDIPDVTAQLANLACSEQAPPFIVLDNLDSANELKALLPRHPRSIIVATSRNEGDPPTTYESIRIDRMERPESIEMVKRQLPTLSDEDTENLVSAFSDYPLIIRYVCGLFPNQSTSMTKLCQELKRDAQKLAAQVHTEDQSILLVILRRMVKLIRQRDRGAFELLALMSFVGPRIIRSVLQAYFVTFLRARESSDVRFAYAIGILKAFSLIQAELPLYSIHPFTQAVLRQEFDSRLESSLVRVLMITRLMFGPRHEKIGQALMVSSPVAYLEVAVQVQTDAIIAMYYWQNRQPDRWSWPEEKRMLALEDLTRRYFKGII